MKNSVTLQPLQRHHLIRLIAFVGVLAISLLVLLKVQNMLLSFVLAFVISYLLGPWVNYLERAGWSRFWSTTFTFVMISLFLIIAISATTPLISGQVSAFKSELPKYIEGTSTLFREIETRIEHITGTTYRINVGEQVEQILRSWTSSLFEDLPVFLSRSVTVILLAPFFAFFLLKDGRSFTRAVLELVPNNIFELTLNLYHQINDQMGQFVRARLLEAGIVGLLVWVGLAVFSFPYATLLAMFAALMNLIPYVGPLIGAVPALLIALINGDTLSLLTVILVYSISQIIDIVFIIPLVVAKIVDLHPITVVIAIIIGAQLMGVLGMLISIPVTSALKVTISTIYKHLVDFRA